MRNRKFIYSLLSVSLVSLLSLSVTGKVWAWGATGSDGGNYQALQETAVFFNNAGVALTAGEVVMIDPSGPGVSTGTTLGSYVQTWNTRAIAGMTQADNILVIGVVKSVSAADQTPVIVVTKGPVETTCSDSSDGVTQFAAVGLSGTAGRGNECGGGTNLGIALEAGDGTNSDELRVWVDPTGAD